MISGTIARSKSLKIQSDVITVFYNKREIKFKKKICCKILKLKPRKTVKLVNNIVIEKSEKKHVQL